MASILSESLQTWLTNEQLHTDRYIEYLRLADFWRIFE